jgi:hypothetical protein
MDHRLVHKKQDGECSRNGCMAIAIAQPSQRAMPREFARYALVREVHRSRVTTKSAESGEPVFSSMDVLRTVDLRRAIFLHS